MTYSKVLKFRDLQTKSFDFDFVFIGKNFVYVLLLFLYQRIYHAVNDFEKNFQLLFWTLKNFPRLLRNYRTFDAVWDFIVLDRTPQDF